MDLDLNEIKESLARIRDPRSGSSIVDAGLIKDVFIEGNNVNISIYVNNLESNDKTRLHEAVVYGIQSEYPEVNINIHMVTRADNIPGKASPLPQIKHIIAVASGKGGVGKSTVSVNLALALKRQGYKVGILDADVYGPSIPTMLGLQGKKPRIDNAYGKSRLVPLESNGIQCISIGFIVEPEQALVLRGPRLAGIVKQFIDDTLWGALDFLIVDLPPGTGDVQLTLVQSVPLSGAVMVTTPQEVALIDAVRAMNMFKMEQINVNILGVIENMSWFTPAELPDSKYYIFGKGGGAALAQQAGAALLGQVPLIMSIRENSDQGRVLEENIDTDTKVIVDDIAKNLILHLNKILEVNGKARIVEIKT